MIWAVVFNMFKIIISVLKFPFYFILIIIALFSLLVVFNICIGLKQGKRFKKGEHISIKKPRYFKAYFS